MNKLQIFFFGVHQTMGQSIEIRTPGHHQPELCPASARKPGSFMADNLSVFIDVHFLAEIINIMNTSSFFPYGFR